MGDFEGCVSATALDTARIKVNLEFPTGSTSIKVLRNGVESGIVLSSEAAEFIDTGLKEDVTYKYTCVAEIGGYQYLGTGSQSVATLNVNPPDFAGVVDAVENTDGGVKVTWEAPTALGVSAHKYKVYYNRLVVSKRI